MQAFTVLRKAKSAQGVKKELLFSTVLTRLRDITEDGATRNMTIAVTTKALKGWNNSA